MKFTLYISSILLLALAMPAVDLLSAPRRLEQPKMEASDGDMSSIAKESDDGESSDSMAKMTPPYSAIPAMVVKPSEHKKNSTEEQGQDETAELAKQETSAEPQEEQAAATEQQDQDNMEPEPEKVVKKSTITDALMQEGWQEDEVNIGGEDVEWVGRDRRIKRIKETQSTINLKTRKPPGKLIITDQYHKSPTELLGITQVRKYGARPDESKWYYSGSKFNCELRHPIPGFGFAVMKQGIQEPLQFVIETNGLSGGSGQARIQSRPPLWTRFTHPKDLGVVNVEPRDRVLFTLTDEWVKRLMLELEDGMVPTISFWDDDTGGEDIVLTVSAFNFQKHLMDFSKCRGDLLPYTFSDVRKRTVYFGYDKYKLSAEESKRLKRLIEYVKLDDEIKKVDITGFSDSVGFSRYNQTLARRRANAVKKFMIAEGLPAKKLVVSAKGEKGKTHSNRTESGRAKNRRVEVTLVK